MPKTPAERPAPGLHVAIVEPASLLGRDVKAVLTERAFPAGKLHLFHARSGTDGFLTEEDDEAAYVAPLTADALDICHVAFFCGRAEESARFFASRGDDRCLAVDLSGVREGGPFVVAGEEPLPTGRLFLLRDPTSWVLAEAVRILDRLSPVEGLTVAVDRPASELGRPALEELFQQAIALGAFRSVPKEIFDTQSAFNIFHPADTEAFEKRVAEDLRALVGREIGVTVLSARAGVFHGHLLRIEARFDGRAPAPDEVRRVLFANGTSFEEVDPENLSGPVESAGRDETLVLRVASSGRSLLLALASDHLRRGGALMAVRVAEQAVRERALLADA